MYLNALSIFIHKYQLKKINIKLLMYGKNIDSNNQKLIHIIKKYNLSSFVELKGYVDDVTIALKQINFLGLCSSYGESFPNVLAEAMLSGVPCFSTDIGEAKNILSNYGKISLVNDTIGFSKSIEEYYMLYKNKRDYLTLSEVCTKHIMDNYSIDKMYCQYEKLWFEKNE
jgi:glycosyltransferase involved in cell wall biosynthesis